MKQDYSMVLPEVVKKALDILWKDVPDNLSNICYTYGDTCYTAVVLSKDLEVHEKVHSKQQGDSPDKWWERYAIDSMFRYEQELEAYKAQYKYLKSCFGKIKAFEYAKLLASDMASPIYGGMCTYNKALYAITTH